MNPRVDIEDRGITFQVPVEDISGYRDSFLNQEVIELAGFQFLVTQIAIVGVEGSEPDEYVAEVRLTSTKKPNASTPRGEQYLYWEKLDIAAAIIGAELRANHWRKIACKGTEKT